MHTFKILKVGARRQTFMPHRRGLRPQQNLQGIELVLDYAGEVTEENIKVLADHFGAIASGGNPDVSIQSHADPMAKEINGADLLAKYEELTDVYTKLTEKYATALQKLDELKSDLGASEQMVVYYQTELSRSEPDAEVEAIETPSPEEINKLVEKLEASVPADAPRKKTAKKKSKTSVAQRKANKAYRDKKKAENKAKG